MSNRFDGLMGLHETPDPTLTKQGRAMRYKQKYDLALKATQNDAERTISDLKNLQLKVIVDAYSNAGLTTPLLETTGQEIRAALSNMSHKERDDAIRFAAKSKDVDVLKAVMGKSPILTGNINHNVDALIDTVVTESDPAFLSNLDDIKFAVNAVKMASEAFKTGADGMRNPHDEEKAQKQMEAIAAASEKLAS